MHYKITLMKYPSSSHANTKHNIDINKLYLKIFSSQTIYITLIKNIQKNIVYHALTLNTIHK